MSAGAVLAASALLAALLWPGVAQADPVKKPTTVKKPVAHTSATKRSTGKSTAATSRRTSQEAASGTARVRTRKVVVTRKKVHGKWVRVTQIVHAEPGPSYQTHPDPERYTQIQQALANNGYFKGQVNGQWGDDSVAAMKQFQADRKIPTDGKISSLSLIGLGLGPNRETGATPAKEPPAAPTPPSSN